MPALDFFGPGYGVSFSFPPGENDAGPVPLETTGPEDITHDVLIFNGDAAFTGEAGKEFAGSRVKLRDYIQSLEMHIHIGGFATSTLTLGLPYDLAIRLLETRLMDFGIIMNVRLGYSQPGALSYIWRLTTQYPEVQLNPKQTTITFRGNGPMHTTSKRETVRVWPMVTAKLSGKDVVETIAASIACSVQYSSKGKIGAAPKALSDPTRWRFDIEQKESDYEFLKKILKSCYCDCSMNAINPAIGQFPLVLTVFDIDVAYDSPPVAMFRVYGQVDSSKSIYPVESFQVKSNYFFQNPMSMAYLRHGGIDPDGKVTPPTLETKTADLGATHGGTTSPQKLDGKTVNAEGTPTKPKPDMDTKGGQTGRRVWQSDRASFPNMDEYYAKKAEYMAGVTATLQVPGVPNIYPGHVVLVDGVGRFNGPYLVQSVVHKIERGFSTIMQIQRNAYSGSNPDINGLRNDFINGKQADTKLSSLSSGEDSNEVGETTTGRA